MNHQTILFMLARLLLALAVALVVPAGVAIATDAGDAAPFLVTAAMTALVGIAVSRRYRGELRDFTRSEAFVLVTATWVTASIVGALPYVLMKGPGFAVDALFESASGFTTTGASILDDVESESAALLVWRSLTQWIGGMGMIVLGIAILPRLAIGGMKLFAAEAPGPTSEKLTPRIAQTGKALWGIYVLLTAVLGGTLYLLGMTPLEALDHSLTTMATGGFSTRNASVGAFSAPIQIVITIFMLLAGINFALHFHLMRGRARRVLRDSELRFYLVFGAGVTALIAADVWLAGDRALDALRLAAFQCASILTTTGFATADFDGWPGLSRLALFAMLFVGGCAGSTAGSIKIVRIQIVLRKMGVEIRRLLQPHAVIPVRHGGRAVPEEVVDQVVTFVLLFVALVLGGALVLALTGLDPVSALSAAATCLANVGPGFGGVGPTHTMSHLSDVAKLTLVSLMIVGRLELYTVLVTVLIGARQLRRPLAGRRVRVISPGRVE